MDDNIISLLIYLAIIIFGGLANAYRKKKAKEAQRPNPMNQPQTVPDKPYKKLLDPFEEIFRELEERTATEEKEVQQSLPEMEYSQEKTDYTPETEINTSYENESLEEQLVETDIQKEGVPVFDETKESLYSSSSLEEYNENTASQISDNISDSQFIEEKNEEYDFDLKSAIIYTEILKRQHF